MNDLVAFLTAMIALSVGVERIVEIIKQIIPPLRSDPTNPKWVPVRRVVLQVLAAGAGASLAQTIGTGQFLPKVVTADGSAGHYCLAGLLAFMASGGSAFWNHALDIASAVKTTREDTADKIRAATAAAKKAQEDAAKKAGT